ncbi:MAG TPA: cupin domain-containing protein [Mycobacteriales bacterium]|jgi:Uncharacterized conserved protein, contains double-stranded beta-helix domain
MPDQSIDPVLRWDTAEQNAMLPGIRATLALGAQLSAAFYTLDPNAVVPDHDHHNEEFGQVISGSLELRWVDQRGEHTATLVAGEGFILPGGARHGAVAGPDGCRLLECYAPPRTPSVPPSTDPQSTEDS